MNRSTLRMLIVSTVVTISSLGAFVFMVLEVGSKATLLTEQIATLEAQQAQQNSFLALERKAEESISARSVLSSQFLAKESDSIDFLNTIETLAPQLGVQLQTEGLKEVGTDETPEWIEVTFSLAGSRQRLQQFLLVLEKIPYVSQVMSIELSAVTAGEWKATVIMQVRVLNYDT